MKKLFLVTILAVTISCQQARLSSPPPNTLTVSEQQQGWQLLFDGESLSQWTGIAGQPVPTAAWQVVNGELLSVPAETRTPGQGGDIITIQRYANFEFKVDFKFNQPANSGIKYFIQDSSSIGFEYQIINRPEGGPHDIADLYDLLHSETAAANAKTDGDWNQAHIIVNGNHVEHWLNNVKALECERNNDEFRERIAGSKFRDFPGFGGFSKGHILLQDHGGGVAFRNIKIKNLP
ncbi:MAG TPA: DUF1080 domain-containing protein [bacterium]|nr:DUF1080 domain-containing protein [bacterium]HPN43978.1 DUF1080 domain-containing protein [bacterium]